MYLSLLKRWLTKSEMLKRFYGLRKDITHFINIKHIINRIKSVEWMCYLTFLIGATEYVNELNLKL